MSRGEYCEMQKTGEMLLARASEPGFPGSCEKIIRDMCLCLNQHFHWCTISLFRFKVCRKGFYVLSTKIAVKVERNKRANALNTYKKMQLCLLENLKVLHK
jgi:hypothetical protein